MAIILALGACDAARPEPNAMPGASPARGRAIVEKVGCGACHTIPGIRAANGRVGPPLEGFADRALIAGDLPNRPDALASWVRNAPGHDRRTAMPPMPLTEQEARDVAAFLYTLHDE